MVLPQAPPVDDIVNERYSDTVYRFLIWARYIRYSCPRVHTEQDIDTSISIHHFSDTSAIQRQGGCSNVRVVLDNCCLTPYLDGLHSILTLDRC